MEDVLEKGAYEDSIPSPVMSSQANAEIDRELEAILKRQSARIKVIGVGGGGGSTTGTMNFLMFSMVLFILIYLLDIPSSILKLDPFNKIVPVVFGA